ncbi:hypothetical protein FD754_019482 [Muntiacus muntjak]|uniref:Uncharacterized protein n=1 Tax=Muntiacus muntjak TaxID=9888 RepID=A0A5N3V0A1_MUNMU|nr:hypothetical protein FD754_019482 [Muntiacus muntjak]
MDNLSAEGIQLRANQVTDQSAESTRRIPGLAIETQDAGIKTIPALVEQGEQLKHTEGGLCVCPCNKTKNIELTPIKIILIMPMAGQRNSLTVKVTAVLLYHLFTSPAPPSKALPFQSLKFCYVGKYLGITAPYFI